MTTGNLSTLSRVGVYGSTPFQHELTSPSLTGTWTVPTGCTPQSSATMPQPRALALDGSQELGPEQVLTLMPTFTLG